MLYKVVANFETMQNNAKILLNKPQLPRGLFNFKPEEEGAYRERDVFQIMSFEQNLNLLFQNFTTQSCFRGLIRKVRYPVTN